MQATGAKGREQLSTPTPDGMLPLDDDNGDDDDGHVEPVAVPKLKTLGHNKSVPIKLYCPRSGSTASDALSSNPAIWHNPKSAAGLALIMRAVKSVCVCVCARVCACIFIMLIIRTAMGSPMGPLRPDSKYYGSQERQRERGEWESSIFGITPRSRL